MQERASQPFLIKILLLLVLSRYTFEVCVVYTASDGACSVQIRCVTVSVVRRFQIRWMKLTVLKVFTSFVKLRIEMSRLWLFNRTA